MRYRYRRRDVWLDGGRVVCGIGIGLGMGIGLGIWMYVWMVHGGVWAYARSIYFLVYNIYGGHMVYKQRYRYR